MAQLHHLRLRPRALKCMGSKSDGRAMSSQLDRDARRAASRQQPAASPQVETFAPTSEAAPCVDAVDEQGLWGRAMTAFGRPKRRKPSKKADLPVTVIEVPSAPAPLTGRSVPLTGRSAPLTGEPRSELPSASFLRNLTPEEALKQAPLRVDSEGKKPLTKWLTGRRFRP